MLCLSATDLLGERAEGGLVRVDHDGLVDGAVEAVEVAEDGLDTLVRLHLGRGDGGDQRGHGEEEEGDALGHLEGLPVRITVKAFMVGLTCVPA